MICQIFILIDLTKNKEMQLKRNFYLVNNNYNRFLFYLYLKFLLLSINYENENYFHILIIKKIKKLNK